MPNIEITKLTFKKTEAEWFNYHKTVKEIKLLENVILNSYKDPDENIGGGRSNIPKDPTAVAATRLTNHKQLNYLKEIANAIETVYNSLPDEYKRLIHSRYWSVKNLTWNEISKRCHVSKRQAMRWRDSIVIATIEILGWR